MIYYAFSLLGLPHTKTFTMKKNYSILKSVLIILSVIVWPSMMSAQDKGIDLRGAWMGSIKVQGTELRLVMQVAFNETDSMIVTFDSPDQGAKGIPTSKVILRKDSVFITSKKIGGNFTGKINDDHSSIPGLWKQGGMSFPLIFNRQERPVIVNRPQEPKPPYPYRSEDISFTNASGGFDLAGTLTVPDQAGRYPAAILISGSGPQNRDEELAGHKPFMVLADYLTRLGMAVLRYDDRGVGRSGGSFNDATTADFATDAEAAVNFLKNRKDIDTTRIGFIGHSEGGTVAPIVASQRSDLAFLILMAAPGLPGEQILIMQSELISKAEGIDEKTIKTNEKLSRNIYSVLKKTNDNEKAGQKIKAIFIAADKKNASETASHHMTVEQINAQVETLTSPWFRSFLTLNPEEFLSKVKCPLLAINGSLDLQVPPRENLQAIEKAMIFGGNANYMVEELPGLNHLFQTAVTGSPTEYAKIEETISPAVLEIIGDWLKTNVVDQ